jgi:hypothetical protein
VTAGPFAGGTVVVVVDDGPVELPPPQAKASVAKMPDRMRPVCAYPARGQGRGRPRRHENTKTRRRTNVSEMTGTLH